MSKITPLLKQRVLAMLSNIENLRHLGVVLSVDGEVAVVRKPQDQQHHSQHIVIELTTDKNTFDWKAIREEGSLMAINCSAAAVLVLLFSSGVAAAPISGGTSLVVSGMAKAGGAATALSCAISAVRTLNVLAGSSNKALDDMPAYQTSMKVLDGVSLVGVGASLIQAGKAVWILAKANIQISNAITGEIKRQQGSLLAKEIIRDKHPGISNKKLKALTRQGRELKRYRPKDITEGAMRTLKDSFGAGLSMLSSALDGNIKDAVVYIVDLQP